MYDERNKDFDKELFANPTAEYRGAPFWAWNDDLKKDELCRQIEEFKKMGFGGFNMHPRQGLATKYLSDEFMDCVKACIEKAESENMEAWLYDEDRYPSGFAGGIVTANPDYRKKEILFSFEKDEDVFSRKAFSNYYLGLNTDEKVVDESTGYKDGLTYLLAAFKLDLKDGLLNGYKLVTEGETADCYVYVRIFPSLPGWNGVNVSDLMQKEAVDKFLECTYEAYYKLVGDKFGKSVPAIFTDEPQVSFKTNLPRGGEGEAVFSWTTDFPLTFKKDKGYDIVPHLPELFIDGKEYFKTRKDYFDHQAERLRLNYTKRLGDWCRAHNIAFAGHYAQEDMLENQSRSLGEAMRLYADMDIPGLDVLVNVRFFNTAKQVVSVARQTGKPKVLSEMYGVTRWDFDFCGHKYQGDWQAALGINVRVPHLSFYSMRGLAKRDFPASIHYQSCWFEEYKYLEDYFSRLNVVLTRGKAVTDVCVIHPVESYWLLFGTNETSAEKRASLENIFFSFTETLLTNQIDFDFVSEKLLTELYKPGKDFTVGESSYKVVIVPPVLTLRESTVKALYAFVCGGGKVLFTGSEPKCFGTPELTAKLYAAATKIPFTENDVLSALSDEREIFITDNAFKPVKDYVHMRRREKNGTEWLFFARKEYDERKTFPSPEHFKAKKLRFKIKGLYDVELFDAFKGTSYKPEYFTENGYTVLPVSLYSSDSLLLKLSPAGTPAKKTDAKGAMPKETVSLKIPSAAAYTLSEPNVMVLDFCEYSMDGNKYYDKEEIIRINGLLREKFGYPPEKDGIGQPYHTGGLTKKTSVYLKFRFQSEDAFRVNLAYEYAEEIILNGEEKSIKENGYFTDRHIKATDLGYVKKGLNELIVKAPFGENISVENYFLTGDFGVSVMGDDARLTSPKTALYYSDVTAQGLPFYGGAIEYEIPFECEKGAIEAGAEIYAGVTASASLDGKEIGKLAFTPYKTERVSVDAGKHVLKIKVFLSRVNSFGALHACTRKRYFGVDSWMTEDSDYSREYILRPSGLFKAPYVNFIKE